MTLDLPNDTPTYLRIINGFLSMSETGPMTDRELEVLGHFIDQHRELREEGMQVHPFHPLVKRRVATLVGRNNFHTLNNYVKAFKDKGLIKTSPDGYRFHPIVVPQEKVTFAFTKG